MFAVTGIYIDGSHTSAVDFQVAVIRFAVDRGYEIDSNQMDKDVEWMNSDLDDEDTLLDILDSLDWTYEGALDYLNSTAPDNLVWTVEDNSLFLEEADD
jgi:hypothetical protein